MNYDPNTCCADNGNGTGNSSTSSGTICSKCMLDDVNGDGTQLVPYVEAFYKTVDENGMLTVTPLGTFTDGTLSTPYTIQGTPTSPDSGALATFKSGRIQLTDASNWTPPATVHSYTIVVESLGAGVTFTDSNSVVTNLSQGRAETWSHEEYLSDNAPIVTGTLGSIITIIYTEIG